MLHFNVSFRDLDFTKQEEIKDSVNNIVKAQMREDGVSETDEHYHLKMAERTEELINRNLFILAEFGN